MAVPLRYAPGDEVREGRVYRRIPNYGTYFDYENEMVHVSLFVPRPRDKGVLSAFLNRADAIASLECPEHAGFGLCGLEIAAMRELTAEQARIEFAPTLSPFGASHVKILGCLVEEVREALSLIAEVELQPVRETGT